MSRGYIDIRKKGTSDSKFRHCECTVEVLPGEGI